MAKFSNAGLGTQKRNLADIIMGKLSEAQQQDENAQTQASAESQQGLNPKVVEVYTK